MFGEAIPTVPTVKAARRTQGSVTHEVFARLALLPPLQGLPAPWRFVPDKTISRYFGITTRTLARWREAQHSPRWAFDDRRRTYWYQPGVLLLWGHRFMRSEEEILWDWFDSNLRFYGLPLDGQIRAFERVDRDSAPDHLRYPSQHSNFASNLNSSTSGREMAGVSS